MDKNEFDQTLTIDENLESNPLRPQRLDGISTDFNLNVHGKVFKCHRSILTTASPFFETKLKSSKRKNEIEIDWDDLTLFECVLDYMYTGKIELTKDNFDKVLELSHLLSINKLKGYCEEYIESFISLENCLRFKELCENHKLTKASEHCLNFVNDYLMDVLALDDFLQLSAKNVELFFTDPATGCDNIPLINLLEVLSRWVQKDVDSRIADYQKLLSILDWSNCSSKEIFDYLKSENLFEESKICLYIVLLTIDSNNIDLENYKSVYAELKKTYDNENENEAKTTTKKGRAKKRNVNSTNDGQIAVNDNEVVNDKRQAGKRQIKRKFDSQEWVTGNNNSTNNAAAVTSTNKKRRNNSNSIQSAIDNETDRAIYMIKVGNDANRSTNADKVINEVSLVAMNNKSSPVKSNSIVASKSSNNNIPAQIAIVQLEPQNDDSNLEEYEHDESEFDVELGSDKEGVMKTEYCVRGKKHSATLAQWKEGVKCPKCTYVGHSAVRLEQHLSRVHEEDTTYICKYCEFTCKWNREYYKHMKTHFKGPPYNCSECDYTCDRVQFILSHLMRHTDERPFACDQCSFRSRTKGNLVVHYRIHTGEKPYKCSHCDKRFAMKNTLDQHMATHRDDRPYLCDKCGFTTKYQSHLLSHKRIHTGNVFYCEQENCNYFSPRRSQLAAHMRSHLSIRSHVCPTCGRAFIERSHLIRHERIHLEEKPFKCEQCEYGSTRRDKLKEHVLKHHSQASEKTFKPRKAKKNDSGTLPIATNKHAVQQNNQQQYQLIQQVHFENADQIPEEVQQQIIAHYQNQQSINSENVSITIGDNVYESQLIVNESELIVTPVNTNNQTKSSIGETSNQPEIQITNVSDQEIVQTDLVEFVLV